jgi:hypothetical protein
MEKAFLLYQNAARQGYAPAQEKLGAMYASGTGVNADPEQAYFWSTLAAKQREKAAQRRLEFLATKMTPDAISRAQKSAGAWKPVLTAAK